MHSKGVCVLPFLKNLWDIVVVVSPDAGTVKHTKLLGKVPDAKNASLPLTSNFNATPRAGVMKISWLNYGRQGSAVGTAPIHAVKGTAGNEQKPFATQLDDAQLVLCCPITNLL
eukprot:PhF_6_TR38614/c0_g1_i1/m.57522